MPSHLLCQGLSGRVKLPPKTVAKNGDTDTKEVGNKL